MQYLTEDLLSSIKLRSMVPISQATFQDADLIMLANEELQLKLVSDIMSSREDFFLTNESKPLTALVDTYTMPSRAIGNALKLVWYISAQGSKAKLPLMDSGELAGIIGPGVPTGFFIQGDQIVTDSVPNVTAGLLRFDFYSRPNKMVSTSSCAKITGVTSLSGTTTFAVDTDLTASFATGSLVDVVSMASPFLLWGYKVPITAITTNSIAVASAGISDQASSVEPVIGDYICPTGTANIAQVPQEFHPVLAQMVANRLLLGLGDLNKYNSGMATLKEDRANALKLIQNRVEESPKVIKNTNGMIAAFSRRF